MQEKYVIFERLKGKTTLVGSLIKSGQEKVLTLVDGLEQCNVPFQFIRGYGNGIREFGTEQVDKWIRNRIPPPYRQDIDDVLRALGVADYDEWEIFKAYSGRSARDFYFIERVQ